MSIRGRRLHSALRRLTPPSAGGRPATLPPDCDPGVEPAQTPAIDADRLIASFRVRAYAEARQRQRRAPAPEAAAHWREVASLIARRTTEPPGEDRSKAERAEARGVRPAIGFFEVDTLDELERILSARTQRFRLQFFGAGPDLGPTVLSETEIEAPDASAAIREAAATIWPARAVGLRLIDLEGREIFERLKADLR